MPNRKEKLLTRIDPTHMTGLEIGPLMSPIVTKDQGEIYYLDHVSTEDLRKKYGYDPGVDKSRIVDVSFVAPDGDLATACAGKQFDYVIASHVIEHIPNMIGWLREIAGLLHLGGKLSLAIPDKRFTFDHYRFLTPLGDLVEAFLENRKVASPKDVFDYWSNVAVVDHRAVWDGTWTKTIHSATKYYGIDHCMETARKQFLSPAYFDAHCTVVTPESFLNILADVARLGLLDFVCVDFYDTAMFEIEFFVTLEKVHPGFDRTLQAESFLRFLPTVRNPSVPSSDGGESESASEITLRMLRDSLMRVESAAEAQKGQLRGALERASDKAAALDREVRMLRDSLSWKITAPLRRIASAIWLSRSDEPRRVPANQNSGQ
jgi:SAM-dependent methyltransferase